MLPTEWLQKEHPDSPARESYVAKHLLGDIPDALGEFEGFYEDVAIRLEEKIRQLLGSAADNQMTYFTSPHTA